MSYVDLVQGNVAQFLPYNMHKPLDVVQKEMGLSNIYRFHALESPFGVSKKVSKVLANYAKTSSGRYSYPHINLYPSSDGYKLKQKLKSVFDYDLRNIVVGGGAHELSALVLNTFLQAGMTAVMPHLSSYEIEHYLSIKGVKLVLTPISEDWSPNFDMLAAAVQEHDARVVYIANPSIPIGGFAVHARFKKFLSRINPYKTIVVVNEEFIDYLGDGYKDMYNLISAFPNLVLIRSFSHAYGLTDLRIGYLLATEEIASILNVVHMPYQVSQLAQDCACAALEDMGFIKRLLSEVNVERNRFKSFCTFFSLRMINTVTNSVTIPLGSRFDRIYHELQREGVFIRDLSCFNVPELCNITIGRAHHNDHLLNLLEKALMEHIEEVNGLPESANAETEAKQDSDSAATPDLDGAASDQNHKVETGTGTGTNGADHDPLADKGGQAHPPAPDAAASAAALKPAPEQPLSATTAKAEKAEQTEQPAAAPSSEQPQAKAEPQQPPKTKAAAASAKPTKASKAEPTAPAQTPEPASAPASAATAEQSQAKAKPQQSPKAKAAAAGAKPAKENKAKAKKATAESKASTVTKKATPAKATKAKQPAAAEPSAAAPAPVQAPAPEPTGEKPQAETKAKTEAKSKPKLKITKENPSALAKKIAAAHRK